MTNVVHIGGAIASQKSTYGRWKLAEGKLLRPGRIGPALD